jgi:hypothetical protein
MSKAAPHKTAKEFWTSGRKGTLSAMSQAQVWALTKMNEKHNLGLTLKDIAKEVWTIGQPRCHPSNTTIENWQAVFAQDPDWHPCKAMEEREGQGRKRKFTDQMRLCVKKSAESLKEQGTEPTVDLVRLRCPKATVNPHTGEYFDKKLVLDVFKNDCFDKGARLPWGHMSPISQTALSPTQIKLREKYAIGELAKDYSEQWYYQHCVWFDPNHTILTIEPRAVFDEKQATKGRNRKRWISPDKRHNSRNLKASPFAGKQARKGDRKVWWITVLARGTVHFEVMGSEWEQTGEGQAKFVNKLEAILRKMVGPGQKLPRVVCTDRGPGLFARNGYFIREYKEALSRHGFRAYVGDQDGTQQPGDLADCWPHERIAAWTKNWLAKNPLPKSGDLDRLEKRVGLRLGECAKHINSNYNVDSVCRSWPTTMQKLKDRRGDRLPR